MTLEQLRALRVSGAPEAHAIKEIMGDFYLQPLDEEPQTKTVHLYSDERRLLVICETHDGRFAWCFGHPCNSYTATLAEAEELLFQDHISDKVAA